jgi:hypothetical protein
MFGHKEKSKCEKIREMFSPYLDSRLETVEQDMVKYHAEICAECQHELESLRITRELLRSVPAVPVPRSFTLAEAPARRSWLSLGIPTVPSANLMRMAAVAAVIAFTLVLSLDLSGILSHQTSSETPKIVSLSPEIEEVNPAETSLPIVTPTSDDPSGEGSEIPEATLPEPGSDPYMGIAVLPVVTETEEDTSGQGNISESAEAMDPNGESGVYSPTPRSKTPLWVFPIEIVVGALAIVLGSASLLSWRRKRANR